MFGGGFRGMFGGPDMEEDDSQPSQSSKEVDNTAFYEILGIPKTATSDEIKKQFRKRAVKEHPDKGGDPANFRKLTEAYEVLSNPEKRDLYDRYGAEGVKNGGPPGGDINDLLGSFFGFGGGRQKDSGPKKMKAKLIELTVSLEDIYEGKMLKQKHKRKRTCETCDGKGGQNAKVCPGCKGKKFVTKLTMLGPGMYTQSQGPCGDCRGEGIKMDEKDRCKKCKGERIVDNEKMIEVPLEKGVPEDKDYCFYGEGDEIPGVMAGDLYVRIKVSKHKIYERKGADLFTTKKISLVEALTGVTFSLKFLDETSLNIVTMPGEIISPFQTKTVKGKGMPFYKDAMSHGNLHIKFEVEFPSKNQLKPDSIEQLKKLLPGSTQKQGDFDPKKAHLLQDYDETETNPNAEGGKMKEEDDEDDPRGGGQRVQCAQQ